MNDTLKRCPVCNGEGTYEHHADGWATCSKCGMEANSVAAEALEARNTSRERTCHNADKTGIVGRFECSECEWIEADEPIYCGGCGAKVVEE